MLFTQESDTWSGCRQFADVGVLLQGHGCLGSSQTVLDVPAPCTMALLAAGGGNGVCLQR